MRLFTCFFILALSSCSFSIPQIDFDQNKLAHNTQGPLDPDDDIWEIEVTPGITASMALPKKATLQPKNNVITAQLYWRLPQNEVTHYTLSWGLTPGKLTEQAEFSIDELDVVESKVQGKMYRLSLAKTIAEISSLPADTKEIYYSLQAHNNERSSERTPLARARLNSSN